MSRGPGPFVCVDDGVPKETIATLRAACEGRALAFEHVHAARYDWSTRRRLEAGAMLYRPAVSVRAMAVEQALHAPGVATFYARDELVFHDVFNSWLLHERAGLPVPRTVPLTTVDRDRLEALAASVGGFPLIVKVPGFSGGVGVLRVDSAPALCSWARYLWSQGRVPDLVQYVPDAVHWRVVVVGARAVASYANPADEDDFRSYASEDASDYRAGAEPDLERVAVGAVRALGHEFGGVDVLRDGHGALWLLEANFPCYHAQAQVVGGIDVAGAMVEHLRAKASEREAGAAAAT